MEKIDTFDEKGSFLRGATINEVHQKGLWHQTVAFWLFNPMRKEVYLQLRGPKNRVGANTFDASAGGHLSSGETKEMGLREVQEELGLRADKKDLIYLKPFLNQAVLGSYINNEFCHIYLVKTSFSLLDFKAQKGEVSNIFAIKTDQLDSFLRGEDVFILSLNEKRKISIKEMCLFEKRIMNGYYPFVFEMIQKEIAKNT